jgi:hypothetical protein
MWLVRVISLITSTLLANEQGIIEILQRKLLRERATMLRYMNTARLF